MPPVDDEKLQLDEEAPDKLTLDEASPGGEKEEPTAENLPGLTEKGRENIRKGVAPMIPPTKFEKERPQIPENYGFTPGNIGRNIYEGAKGVIGSAAGGLADIATGEVNPQTGEIEHNIASGGLLTGTHPYDLAKALAHKYVTGPAGEHIAKAEEEYKKGNTLGAIGHGTAAALPLVGPWAAGLGEQAGTGDIGGAAGQAAGTMAGGELLSKGPKAGLKLADKAVRGTPLTEAGKLGAAEQQAMTVKKPAMGELEYANKVHQAIPDLIKIAQDQKGQINTPRRAAQAISDRVGQLEAPISDHLANLPPSPANMVHPTEYLPTVGTAIMQDMAKRPGRYSQAEMAKAGKTVSDFIGDQPKTLEELEGNRRRLNQDADEYFHSDTAGKRAIDVSDATATAQRAAANAIRDILYGDQAGNPGRLERAGVTAVTSGGQQVPIRQLRQKVGNLIDVRDHFEDAITRAEAAGDWNPWAVMKSGPSLAMGGIGGAIGGGIGGAPGAVLGLLAGEGVKAWTDYLRSKNLNLNTQKMFRNLGQVSPQATIEPRIGAPQPPPGQPATGAGGATAGIPATALGPIAPAGGGTPAPVAPMRALPPIGAGAPPKALPSTRLGNIGETPGAPGGVERRTVPRTYTEADLPELERRVTPAKALKTPAFEGTRQALAERTQPEVKHMVKPTETEETRAEAKKKVEKPLSSVEPETEVPYTKTMPMAPSRLRPEAGTTDISVHHHELSHAIVGALNGIEPGPIISHRFQGIGQSTAAALFDLKEFKNPDKFTQRIFGPFKRDLAPEKSQALSDLFAAGAAANEVIDGIPRDKNVGLYGDKRLAKQLFDALGVPLSKHEELWNAAVDRAKEKLTPEIQDVIKDEATRREDNLPVDYHYSENRVKHIIKRVRGLYGEPEQTAVGHEATDIGEGNRGGEENVAGREGAGAQEPRSLATQEKLKPFKPPQNTYHFEVNNLDGSTSTKIIKAIDRKAAFKKISKQLSGGDYEANFLAEEKPEVGPPTELGPIPHTSREPETERVKPMVPPGKVKEGIPREGPKFTEDNPENPLRSMVPREDAEAAMGRRLKRKEGIGDPESNGLVLKGEDGKTYVYGNASTADLTKAWKSHLNPAEMKEWREWYPTIEKQFEQSFGKGPETAKKIMAWLGSQQNTSPSGGMTNVLRGEDILAGQPKIKSAGLAENNIMSLLQGETPKGGMGAKLLDFVDSALGKKTRTFMGDDVRGGAPAVIDVHGARGVGFVDQTLKDMVEKKFGKAAANKLKVDLAGAPSETQYEYGSQRFNDIANELNKKKFDGGGWTPSQVQAVDWARMIKQMGREPELPRNIFEKNIRNISYEVGFSPDAPYSKDFPEYKNLPYEQRDLVTHAVATKAMEIAQKEAGGHIAGNTFGPGGWMTEVSPSVQTQVLASPEAAERAANILGYLLQQDAVLTSRPLLSGNGHFFQILEPGGETLATHGAVQKFWNNLREIYPKAEGFMPVRTPEGTGIQILKLNGHFGPKEVQALENAAQKAAEQSKLEAIETKHGPADVRLASNDWKVNKNGEGYTQRAGEIGRPGLSDRLHDQHGPAIKQAIREAIQEHGKTAVTRKE